MLKIEDLTDKKRREKLDEIRQNNKIKSLILAQNKKEYSLYQELVKNNEKGSIIDEEFWEQNHQF